MEPPPRGQHDRAVAFGEHLIEVHDLLREEIARLRNDVKAYASGTAARPRELRAHCLAFCAAIGEHHTREDAGVFPAVAERFPELAPAIERLIQDHETVSGLLRNLRDLTKSLDLDGGPAEVDRIADEVEGLSAILESHFRYEEHSLFDALNSLSAR